MSISGGDPDDPEFLRGNSSKRYNILSLVKMTAPLTCYFKTMDIINKEETILNNDGGISLCGC